MDRCVADVRLLVAMCYPSLLRSRGEEEEEEKKESDGRFRDDEC